ncbi:hypothetical protein V2G26_001710 [Clonostachys chloroleuca]
MALDRYPTKIEAGILHLPDLVMHRICTFFCKHFAKFHYNAQRILYHNIDIQIPRNYLQRPLEVTIGLLTSLRINPHLKNLVKSLSIQDVPWAGPGYCHIRESYDNLLLPESLLNDLRTLSHGLRIPLCNVQLKKTNLVETLMQLIFVSGQSSPELKLAEEPAPHLALAMEQLPSLRRLSCEYYGLSWTGAERPHRHFQALKSCSATLQELRISANKSMVLESQLIQAGLRSLKQFKILPLLGFKVLRSFSFDGKIMRRFANSLEQAMPSPDGDELCPVLLPDSLETIHINLDEISQMGDGEFEKPCMDAIFYAGKKNLRMVVISSTRRHQRKFTMANLRAGPRGSRQEHGWEIAEVHDDERLRLTQEEDFPAWDGC